MKEVEVKARVSNLSVILKKLEEIGCKLSEPVIQKDIIFLQNGTIYPVGKGKLAVRIREQDSKFIFNLKQSQNNELDNYEREVVIDNPAQMKDIIIKLGFYEAVHVSKTRRKCRYQGMEICIDQVDQLGSFIEVEKISEGNGLKIQEELFSFLKSLGVKEEERVKTGYDTMMAEIKAKS